MPSQQELYPYIIMQPKQGHWGEKWTEELEFVEWGIQRKNELRERADSREVTAPMIFRESQNLEDGELVHFLSQPLLHKQRASNEVARRRVEDPCNLI